MKAVKRINNNVALCEAKDGKEFIARGKGIGFHEFPYELNIKDVEKTYYDVDPVYVSMIDSIPEDIFDLCSDVIDFSSIILDNPLSANVVFTLADHINFAIERNRKNMNIKLPIIHDVEHLFPREYKIGKESLKLIKKRLGVWLPNDEAAYIALHIINAEEQARNIENIDNRMVEDIVKIVESEYEISINIESVNYSRFVSHLHYLLKRGRDKELIKSENVVLFKTTKEAYPKVYECAEKISDYLKKELKFELSDEEVLYLMLHINRLCSREECYR
ncbi:MAG: PRD domain-containing protein [Solobacterium sp.]|nr:PRD domain-containing protein [Solobacterium sp.]MDD6122724.1 PRD domain-containing protein [Solobacterium sp.]MDD6497848.1 PRD domain-containing protein [Solobacterium sp.]MDD6835004.1 PRD domain-containing protein [Solobacterium sp.]MDD6885172.1 PRD domain-containing protein [Solobacterium sp.]